MHDAWFQQFVHWLTLGCIYSLLALGFSLLFGVLRVIHFSHGDVALVGAALLRQFLLALHGGGNFWICLVVAAVVATVFGFVLAVAASSCRAIRTWCPWTDRIGASIPARGVHHHCPTRWLRRHAGAAGAAPVRQ